MIRYELDFLLALQDQCQVGPDNIAEIQSMIDTTDYSTTDPNYYQQPARSRSNKQTQRSHKRSQRQRQQQQQKPKLQITRRPNKTGRSQLIMLLNKMGENFLISNASDLYKLIKEDVQDLVPFLCDITFKQAEILSVYAQMWMELFVLDAKHNTKSEIKESYMNYCRNVFENLAYDNSEIDNEKIIIITTCIVELYSASKEARTMYGAQIDPRRFIISYIPLKLMMTSYLKHITEIETCATAIHIILGEPEMKDLLIQIVKGISDQEKRILVQHIVNNSNMDKDILHAYSEICQGLLVDNNHCAEFKQSTLSRMPDAPLPLMIVATTISDITFYEECLRVLFDVLPENNKGIECVLALFNAHGRSLQKRVPEIVERLYETSNAYQQDARFNMKWKFKFMDFTDLYKRNWAVK